MINPKDIELFNTEENKKNIDPNMLEEFRNNKGDDEDDE